METRIVKIWSGQRGTKPAVVRLLDAVVAEQQLARVPVEVAIPDRVGSWNGQRKRVIEVRAGS